MTSRLKEHASIIDQMKLLATLARQIDKSHRPALDVITSYLNFNAHQMRLFIEEYRKEGDDPLEV